RSSTHSSVTRHIGPVWASFHSSGCQRTRRNRLPKADRAADREKSRLALRGVLESREHPEYDNYLGDVIADIEEDELDRGEIWEAASLNKLLKDEHAINEDRDLHAVVCEALEEIKTEIESGDWVDPFWDDQTPRGKRSNIKNWRPKGEVPIQNAMWVLVKEKLQKWDILGIEEACVAANRADFECLKRIGRRQSRVFIEVKSSASEKHAKLIKSIDEQLYGKYMKPRQVAFGIHITFWFRDDKRCYEPKLWATVGEMRTSLEEEAEQVSRRTGTRIAVIVIDATTIPRRY
ncbi:MAG TPA: hypothetical protein VM186_12810, partial [Planctomycetota bacterium]|nr:hypothetical protein [Planctomycetota bacterium]